MRIALRETMASPPGIRNADAAPARPWLALAFIALAQLMVALDATVVSIALPSVQRDLGFSDAARQSMITAYTVPFAGLLLVGGRLADSIGRRRAMSVGLVGFSVASALGGAATTFPLLIAARAAQGVFAALLSPTALSLVAVVFRGSGERAKAFAVYGAIAGSGGAVGLIAGGALTEWTSWRWCLYINVAIAVVAFLGARKTLAPDGPRNPLQVDFLGALLATSGLAAVVLGCARGASPGHSRFAVALASSGLVLLLLFVAHERGTKAPLIPLHIVRDRNRGGANIAAAFAVVGMLGLFLLLAYYFQVVREYGPLRAGFAFLPMTAGSLVGSAVIARLLLPRLAPRILMVPALVVGAVGMLLLGRIGVDTRYASGVLPGEVLVGLGIGCTMVPAFSLGTQGVDPREAGVASAIVNTATQVGGSLGAALLNTVAATTTTALVLGATSRMPFAALVHGYAVAADWAAGVFALAALLVAGMVNAPRDGSATSSSKQTPDTHRIGENHG